MFTVRLAHDHVQLIEPDPRRDAPLGVRWLAGEQGRQTLRLMGVAEASNKATTLEQERRRVQSFLDRTDHFNWMIEVEGRVVGSIWVDLEPTRYVSAPTISVMIGDPSVRGRGVGSTAMRLVLDYLQGQGYPTVHARYLMTNDASRTMNERLGFRLDGQPYFDEDRLEWQNIVRISNNSNVTD